MDEEFRNRTDWATLVIAMIIFSAHFTVLWATSIVFPGQPPARWLALVFTLAAFGALWWLWRRAARPSIVSVPGLGIALAFVGVAYDALPALIG